MSAYWRTTAWCRHLVLFSLFWGTGLGIRVVEVVVPQVVSVGESVVLECRYSEEGDPLYTLKWWRGDDQFYQLVPPKRSYYPADGVSVNMSATEVLNPHGSSGLERVVLEPVGLDAAGEYKCEVMADISFHTVSERANMTVVYTPKGAPHMYGMEDSTTVRTGQRVLLNCSVPPASPPPVITWLINNRRAPADWYVSYPSRFTGGSGGGGGGGSTPVRVSSTLDFAIPDGFLRDGSLHIQCVAQQHITGYHEADKLLLHQERQSLRWFFSSGASATHKGLLRDGAPLCCCLWLLLLRERRA